MLHFSHGNLLHAETEAVVNTVNTVGIMGKGIALAFKEAYPENFRAYEAACRAGELHVGRMFVTENRSLLGPRWIINFPTKKHWRHPSKLEWVREGLTNLRGVIQELSIRSIALPPLGCGEGGLDWQDVRSLIWVIYPRSRWPHTNLCRARCGEGLHSPAGARRVGKAGSKKKLPP